MSYATATAAIQPKTPAQIVDFSAGPFASASRQTKLTILDSVLPLYQLYPQQNQAVILSIIAQIKILTSQILGTGQNA